MLEEGVIVDFLLLSGLLSTPTRFPVKPASLFTPTFPLHPLPILSPPSCLAKMREEGVIEDLGWDDEGDDDSFEELCNCK